MRPAFMLPLAACAAILGLSGCTTTVTSGDATTASSVNTSAVVTSPAATNTLPGPHPPPNDNNNGTSFDPCLAYSAAELKSWGVAPGSVEDIANSPGLQRGCVWYGDGWDVQQTVLNGSVDRFRNQELFPGSEPVVIEGLDAVRWPDEVDPKRVCYVELPSQRATVGTIVGIRNPQAQRVIPDACAKAMAIATDTAKKLPK
ncbi:DUF3558 domain-containing protein [Mycobacteroides abscessus]|uniref:DUF3558 family protein n=1 Tax=Mycobacteroides abscessus TaxID=36809 RepID=UPI001CDD120D|nr:DUF3558 family protein [Mycobacteroides abscessus]MCA4749575.1 DUF3558 domain-containing protein [Mycobacteroides abscessus]MCA4767247.1 DUF3558 domain-containing protein [Mycobacteroides abscessus]UBV08834.1 DUF3558 domain-containing protein [Mycobacteroides abscessus]UBV26027.1 DUF3558 domain-containing protein [Mycobacteroides abscessus]